MAQTVSDLLGPAPAAPPPAELPQGAGGVASRYAAMPADSQAAPKQTVSDILSRPADVLPVIGAASERAITMSPETEAHLALSPAGKVLDAFGQGFSSAWGTQTLPGLSDETLAELRRLGTFNDYQNGHVSIVQSVNEAFYRPAAAALDLFMRGTSAGFAGGQAAVAEAGAQAGQPQLGRELAAIPEAFQGSLHPTGIPKVPEVAPRVPDLARANDLGIIGHGDDGWKFGPQSVSGTATGKMPEPMRAQIGQELPRPMEAPAQPAPVDTAATAPDVHTVARQIAPEVFTQFDTLAQRKDTFRRWLSDLSDTREKQAWDTAPNQAEIADLEARIPDATPRLVKKYQARLDTLIPERDAYIEAQTAKDTPDMALIRQRLMDTDFKMRDLAPQVGQAYRDAEAQVGPAERPAEAAPTQVAPTDQAVAGEAVAGQATQAPQATPSLASVIAETGNRAEATQAAPTEAVAVGGEAVRAPQEAAPTAAQPETAGASAATQAAAPPAPAKITLSSPEQVQTITADVSKKLVAAGRPAEEADAAAALIASHYEARAERFNGAKGSALDLYRNEAPNIKAGREKSRRVKEMAQQTTELNQVRTGPNSEAFNKWFGDSKVVDESGNPAILYHGSTSDFSEFKREHLGKETGAPSAKEGFFFSSNPDVAASYATGFDPYTETKFGRFVQWATGGRYQNFNEGVLRLFGTSAITSGEHVKPVYLSIKNPLVHDFAGNEYRETSFKELIDRAKAEGHDGVIFREAIDPGSSANAGAFEPSDIIVAFEPNQIKSATGNRGTFNPRSANILEQNRGQPSGKIRIAADARNTITLFKSADASTFIHETGHQWLEELLSDAADKAAPADIVTDAQTVRKWLGADESGPITTRQHEKFARGFETYMMEGRAPSSKLAQVFEQFRQWLTAIYQTVAKLRAPINNDIRDVFDRLIVAKPERVTIAPERQSAKGFADVHEVDAEVTPPSKAAPVADQINQERAQLAEAHATPENFNEIRPGFTFGPHRGTANETGSGPLAGPEAASHGDAAGPAARSGGAVEGSGAVGAGGSEAAPEGTQIPDRAGGQPQPAGRVEPGQPGPGPAAGAEPTGLADLPSLPEPPAPKGQSLLQFLRARGGLRPDAEIDAVFGQKKLDITRKDGMSLDQAREAAVEAGYLTDNGAEGGASTSTVRDLLDAMDAENRGNKVYPLGVEPADTTALRAERARLETELSAEMDGLGQPYKDVPKPIRDRALFLMYSEGKDAFSAYEQAVMEGDYYAERSGQYRREAANQLPDESGSAPGAGGIDQAGERAGGSGEAARHAGLNDRSGDLAGPRDANAPFATPASELVDKAGNIRLDKLNTPEDINTVLRDFAEKNGGFMDERGYVPDQQLLSLADAAGSTVTLTDLNRFANEFGRGGLSSKIVKMREMLVESAGNVRETMVKAASGSDADVVAYAQARARHQMIQGTLSAVTAEAGRALRAFRDLQGLRGAQQISDFLKDSTGKTLFQLREEAQLGLKLETPEQVSKFMHDVAKPGFKDMALEAWINALLSGPMTHAANIISNTLVAIYRVPETAIAAGIGAARDALGFGKDRVLFGEVGDELFGMVQGAQEGVRAAWEVLKTEPMIDETTKLEQRRQQAIPSLTLNVGGKEVIVGGRQVRLPGRLLQAEDQVFKSIAYRQTLNALARRQAWGEGLRGEELANRIAEIVNEPPMQMVEAAKVSADYQTFTSKLGKLGSAVQAFSSSHPLVKLVIPFVRTPVNIVKYSAERSLFGLFMKDVRANLAGENGAAMRDVQAARIVLGTAISVTAAYYAASGLITGGGPADSRKRALLYASGWQPYSVKIGDTYYSYQRMEPLGTLLGVAADMVEVAHAMTSEQNENVAKLVFASISKNLTSKTWLSGPSELIQAVNDPDRYGQRYIQRLVGTIVPTALAQYARAQDPFLRDARTVVDGIKARLPGLSQTLPVRRDIWGEPIMSDGSLGPDLISPIYESRIKNDPVDKAMIRLGVAPPAVQRKIRGVDLTAEQYDKLAMLSGQIAKHRLDQIVNQPWFSMLPDQAQRDIITKTITDPKTGARELARNMVMMQYPDIIQKAMDAKVKKLQPQPTAH